jgi:ubiquinone/menaquinone biosynthesis C-methylase UbiE
VAATQLKDEDQAQRWKGSAGCAWVEAQQMLDRTLQPFEDLLVAEVAASGASGVLDVGCGTGSTTIAVAQVLKPHGQSIGIDISEPMVAAARARAEREGLAVRFICANAQEYSFAPARVDMIISRFGVMFFNDPVRAFANLRRATTDNAEARLIAWRSPAENPFMTTAERAAAPLLPNLPARRSDAPGQFAFADRDRVHSILERSGWSEIDIRPVDFDCTVPEKDLVRYVTRLGPVGRVLDETDDETRARVIDAVLPAFDPYIDAGTLRFQAACWVINAQAGPSRP